MKIKELRDLLDSHPDAHDIEFTIDFTNGIHCGETSDDTMTVYLSDMKPDKYEIYGKYSGIINLEREGTY